ncbi:MAG: hypothetical protein IPM34_07500 [Saprospiraceae bacterium]|nr:hypothetical protein [Saprospiraceae bacterium]
MNAQSYLQKHSYTGQLIEDFPDPSLTSSIVVPSFNEPGLFETLQSLGAMHPSVGIAELIVVLNHAESSSVDIKELHKMQFEMLHEQSLYMSGSNLSLKVIPPVEFPDNIAGVGLARKIGMDEAIRRFGKIEKEGILYNIDADCLIDKNYLVLADNFFKKHPHLDACSIGFKHQTHLCNASEVEAIELYELHLRLYINWQKYYAYPFAFQTLGSCFGVRTEAYRKQGGMNRRKAGEDFYFLHKFSRLGKLGNLKDFLVYPSARISSRVPFGTGKAVQKIINGNYNGQNYLSYDPKAIGIFCRGLQQLCEAYEELKSHIKSWSTAIAEPVFRKFLESRDFSEVLKEIFNNSGNKTNFQNRLSKYLDPFLLMKFLHEAANQGFPGKPVMDSFYAFRNECMADQKQTDICSVSEALEIMRNFDIN